MSRHTDTINQSPTHPPSPPPPPPPIPRDVFPLIHDLHRIITKTIDTSLTWEQLNSPPVNYSLVRPIVEKLSSRDPPRKASSSALASELLRVPPPTDGGEDGANKDTAHANGSTGLGQVLFALMANRIQFMTLAGSDLSYEPLQSTRAAFCELLAIKILRTFPHPENEAQLVGELVHGFCAFQGASEDVWQSLGDDRNQVKGTKGSALELAIVSSAKHLLSLPLIQHLIHEIYLGHLIYSPVSSRSLIVDSYVSERTRSRRRASQSRPDSPSDITPMSTTSAVSQPDGTAAEVYVYNPFEAGWLDHQRLRVPKWRKWTEFGSFALLISLFVATLASKNLERLTPLEFVFISFSFGFILEEFAASKEHGWTVYAANAFNAFDMGYIIIFLLYLSLRIVALAANSTSTSDLAFDILACGACILFPRLVFFLIRDNIVILALKAMVARFVSFMALVILAFSGICFCLWTLGRGTWTVKQIVWLMLQIWFGSSYLGFNAGASFHPIFGPIILIAYAALCNVLLITILIAILSNAFAEINQNAQEEHLFQRVVKTFEGVKSDAVFSYLPPVNIAAFAILSPLSFIVSPRTLHSVNVLLIRLTNFPFLLAISAYERHQYRTRYSVRLGAKTLDKSGPGLLNSLLGGGGSEAIIATVFEAESPALDPLEPAQQRETISSLSDAESDSDSSEAEGDMQTRPLGVDSPLARLFGKSSVFVTSESPAVPGHRGKARKHSSRPDLNRIKKLEGEIDEMRASQLRVEEMLAKALGAQNGG